MGLLYQMISKVLNVATRKFLLVSPQYDDLRFPAAGINPPGAASDPTLDTSDGRWKFSATAVNTLAMQVQLPHSWREGSAIRPHVHWSPTDASAGNVKWQMQYKVANVNEAFPANWLSLSVTDAAGGVSDWHEITGLGDIDMTGMRISCMLLVLVSRLGNDVADTYAADVKLNEFDIHFEADSLGSNEEFIK